MKLHAEYLHCDWCSLPPPLPPPPCDWSDDAGNNLLGLSWAAQVARFGQHRVAVNEF